MVKKADALATVEEVFKAQFQEDDAAAYKKDLEAKYIAAKTHLDNCKEKCVAFQQAVSQATSIKGIRLVKDEHVKFRGTISGGPQRAWTALLQGLGRFKAAAKRKGKKLAAEQVGEEAEAKTDAVAVVEAPPLYQCLYAMTHKDSS